MYTFYVFMNSFLPGESDEIDYTSSASKSNSLPLYRCASGGTAGKK